MRSEVSLRTVPGGLKAEQGSPVTSPGRSSEWWSLQSKWIWMGGRKYHLVCQGGGQAQRDDDNEKTEWKHRLLFPSETSGAKHGGKAWKKRVASWFFLIPILVLSSVPASLTDSSLHFQKFSRVYWAYPVLLDCFCAPLEVGFFKISVFLHTCKKSLPDAMATREGRKSFCFSGMPYSVENLRCYRKWKSDFVTNESLLPCENYHSV